MKVLPAPYDAPPSPEALTPRPETVELVRTQVRALLLASPAFHDLAAERRREMEDNLIKIAAYAAECVRDDWAQSLQIGQQPIVKKREVVEAPLARAQVAGEQFQAAAAGQIARITRETLRAIAFPEFVADLIRGTFNAIVNTSIQQMEAYAQLLSNVSKTVDEFMADNISDNQARDWLQQSYPEYVVVRRSGDGARIEPAAGAEERPAPPWRRELNLPGDVGMDESSFEDILVPAARRRLAQTRLQLLSTLVLMGINRIVVTGGKIRATMGFHIDTTDRLHQEHATDFDFRTAMSGSFGYGPWSASASMSVSYVRSTRADSDSEINVESDLTGEVEVHFKSDYFPLERFAGAGQIDRIRGNTAVPEANEPFSAPPAVGGEYTSFSSPRTARTPRRTPSLRPIGGPLPEPRRPIAPPPPETRAPAPEATPATPPRPADERAGAGSPPPAETPAPGDRAGSPAPAPATGASPPSEEPEGTAEEAA